MVLLGELLFILGFMLGFVFFFILHTSKFFSINDEVMEDDEVFWFYQGVLSRVLYFSIDNLCFMDPRDANIVAGSSLKCVTNCRNLIIGWPLAPNSIHLNNCQFVAHQ